VVEAQLGRDRAKRSRPIDAWIRRAATVDAVDAVDAVDRLVDEG
jgi:hypothetical protein